MTPLEETIQQLMEPDKHGEKGAPARTVFLGDTFTRPIQRTLDALWKFAEGVATASRDNMDHYNSAVARVTELEGWISEDGLSVLIAERDRYREALETIANPPGEDATDPDDIAKEVLRLKAPALGCLKCFPGDDCPEGCLDRNYRVTDN